ncbi:molybdopterin synthase sulfur carrier subunit [Azorhizobium oxalatiphilum]|uniref:Molybdopterin synthase sulfur carrier subunit n=1 Tax=Azorhizobium oxalatiphilum TaxID=980631 RepID=A0A917FJ72_9HYPH|nr:molybdopterin converting factor subunit 1 [Azorhizobium oxalatiphilum]GGF88430.1 molybdopterin synthase sulfur carrier subunit [Azorhizobium oxalatiphilum]
MKVLYFAWLRERVGRAEEEIEVPAGITTVADLAGWLKAKGGGHAYAFENPAVVRAALDRRHVKPDAPLGDAREIAFFPPMTGG